MRTLKRHTVKIIGGLIAIVVLTGSIIVGTTSANAATGKPWYAWCTESSVSIPKWVDKKTTPIKLLTHVKKGKTITITCYVQPYASKFHKGEVIWYGATTPPMG